MRPLVEVDGLQVAARDEAGVEAPIVKDVSFNVADPARCWR